MAKFKLIAVMSGLLSCVWLVSLAIAQSGTRSYPPPRSSSPRTEPPPAQVRSTRAESAFEERLWKSLQQAQYKNWAPLPGVPADFSKGNSPHGDQVKLYANRTAASGNGEFPVDSILIQEDFDPKGTKLMAVTVMYRADGYNPEAGDWRWMRFEPSGAVTVTKGVRVAGKVATCIDCHRSAGGNDFVFSNDR